METQFYLLLSLKTPRGFENYGQYFLGNDREIANALFENLKGKGEFAGPALLHIDLMETVDEIPMKIKTIFCTLDELAFNNKLVAREIFKQKNLAVYPD